MLRNAVVLALLAAASAAPRDRSYFEEKFVNWMKQHKVVARDGHHFTSMLENFIKNDMHIESHNAARRTWTLGHNQFSHMSTEEFAAFMKPLKNDDGGHFTFCEETDAPAECDISKLPTEVDLRKQGMVTPVKNQGQCGSCWSFATTGSLEGARVSQFNTTLVSFSEEQLVECDTFDAGCNGGFMDNAYKYIYCNKGLSTEEDYPYVAGGGSPEVCHKEPVVENTVPKCHVQVAPNDCSVMEAVSKRPLAVALYASTMDFQLYKSGVVTSSCTQTINHGVLLVGYGTEDVNGEKVDYYLLKNSWGDSWGDNGYIRLGRGPEYGTAGQCNMFNYPTYPVLTENSFVDGTVDCTPEPY